MFASPNSARRPKNVLFMGLLGIDSIRIAESGILAGTGRFEASRQDAGTQRRPRAREFHRFFGETPQDRPHLTRSHSEGPELRQLSKIAIE
jgi:hypothetical protein